MVCKNGLYQCVDITHRQLTFQLNDFLPASTSPIPYEVYTNWDGLPLDQEATAAQGNSEDDSDSSKSSANKTPRQGNAFFP